MCGKYVITADNGPFARNETRGSASMRSKIQSSGVQFTGMLTVVAGRETGPQRVSVNVRSMRRVAPAARGRPSDKPGLMFRRPGANRRNAF